MRNFYEQKKSCSKLLFNFTIILIMVLYLSIAYLPKAFNGKILMGFSMYVNENADDSKFNNLALVFLSPITNVEAVKDGSILIFKDDDKIKDIAIKSLIKSETGEYIANIEQSGSTTSITIPAKDLLGKSIFSVPYLGYVSNFTNHWASYIVLGVFAFAIIIAIVFAVISKKKKRASQLGLPEKKMNEEDRYIVQQLEQFMKKSGARIRDGVKCRSVVIAENAGVSNGARTGERLFGVIVFESESVYFKVNHNYYGKNGVFSREGFIKIPKAVNLKDAKVRIKKAYEIISRKNNSEII